MVAQILGHSCCCLITQLEDEDARMDALVPLDNLMALDDEDENGTGWHLEPSQNGVTWAWAAATVVS